MTRYVLYMMRIVLLFLSFLNCKHIVGFYPVWEGVSRWLLAGHWALRVESKHRFIVNQLIFYDACICFFIYHILPQELPKDKWFCCDDCNRIYVALQNSVSAGAEIIPSSLSELIIRKHQDKGLYTSGGVNDVQWRILSGKSRYPEHLPLLSRAAAIFRVSI